jgi:hypothetical protein
VVLDLENDLDCVERFDLEVFQGCIRRDQAAIDARFLGNDVENIVLYTAHSTSPGFRRASAAATRWQSVAGMIAGLVMLFKRFAQIGRRYPCARAYFNASDECRTCAPFCFVIVIPAKAGIRIRPAFCVSSSRRKPGSSSLVLKRQNGIIVRSCDLPYGPPSAFASASCLRSPARAKLGLS